MARRGKKTGDGEQPAEAEAETKQTTVVLISEKNLRALLKSDDGYKERIDGLTGELRETIGNAVEKKHLDKDAYALTKKFHRMKSAEKKKRIFETFMAYMQMSGELGIIESVPSLLDGHAAETEETDEPAPANVAHPTFGGGQVAH